MSNLRFLFVSLTAWVVLLLNIGNISFLEFTVPLLLYVTVMFWTIPLLTIPSLSGVRRELMVAAALLIYAGMRYFGVLSEGTFHAPTLITELVILTFTLWLAHKFAKSLSAMENAYSQVIIGNPDDERVVSTMEGIDAINHELFRARRYERPVALMVIRLPRIRQLVDRIGNRPYYQLSLEHQFIKTRVSKIVASMTYDVDTIMWQGDNLIVCLPETDRDQTIKLAKQISRLVTPSLNLELPIGIAVFPTNGLVFDDLVLAAENDLRIYTDNDKLRYLSSYDSNAPQSDASENAKQPLAKVDFEQSKTQRGAALREGFQNFRQLAGPVLMSIFTDPETPFNGNHSVHQTR